MRLLLVDNFDSFTWNLVQLFAALGATVHVVRADAAITESPEEWGSVDGVLLSPGPGGPDDAAGSKAVLHHFAGERPILGVCLGMQVILRHAGVMVGRAPEPRHGKLSRVFHTSQGIFAGLPQRFAVVRYHSLTLIEETMPSQLTPTAWSEDGVTQGVLHSWWPVEGVQFHPESILTEHGPRMAENFLTRCQRFRDGQPI